MGLISEISNGYDAILSECMPASFSSYVLFTSEKPSLKYEMAPPWIVA